MIRSHWLSFWFELAVVLALSLFAVRSEAGENSSGAQGGAYAGSGIVCDPVDPESCSAPTLRGSAAAFSGQLLTPKLAITLGLKAQYCDARAALDVEHVRALMQVDLDSERRLRAIDNEASKKAQELLEKKLADGNPIFERPIFVAAVTTAIVVSAYALAMKSVDWIKVSR